MPAPTLNEKQFNRLILSVRTASPQPVVDVAVFLLSFYGGLRVQEIAGLRWADNLLDVDGDFRKETVYEGRRKIDVPVLYIGKSIGKYGKERTIPLAAPLLEALIALKAEGLPGAWVIPARAKGASPDLKMRAHTLKMRMLRLADAAGMDTVTTHSGRRTLITNRSRQANLAGSSLRDVQYLAGHARLSTTEAYIDTTASQARLATMPLF